VNEADARIEALEAHMVGAYDVLHKMAGALQFQRERIDEEQARLNAHVVLTSAMLQAMKRVAPEAAGEIISLIERTERDFVRSDVHDATVRELREILGALRAQVSTASH
jgi:hypothetical protein